LPFVKNIVINHGGHVELTSQSGQGSTFTMWLPEQSDVAQRKETINTNIL
jgi:signal transduction histidine kinase